MKKKTQIVLIHGGMTFRNDHDYLQYLKTREVSIKSRKRWSGEYLDRKLGKRFELIRLFMPLGDNAKYRDWKITLDRYSPLLRSGVIFIGRSLGGIFLAKYLAENRFPKKILSVYLVCPPYDDSLKNERLAGGFKLPHNLSRLEESCQHLSLMFSRNDDVVPISHMKKYRQKLKRAEITVYENKNGHFRVSAFPEIVRSILRDIKVK